MLHKLLTFVLVLAVATVTVPQSLSAAGPWYVATSGSDSNDCLSWAAACLTIEKALSLASAGDTIYIAVGTYHENELSVNGQRLVGAGAAVTILDAGGTHRVMSVSGETTLSGMTLRNGRAGDGGGIFNEGTLTIEASQLSDNTATSAAGGLYNAGTLALQSSVVSSNTVTGTVGFGGGIVNAGVATIRGSTIRDNTSTYIGGLHNNNTGSAEIANSTFSGNEATEGYSGALHNQQAMTLTNVTVSGNLAVTTGGGIGNTATGALIVLNSTIANNENTGGFGGGGLHTFGISVTLKNTILAANLPTNCGFTFGNAPTSDGHNLDSGSTCSLTGPGDLSDTNPLLGPLQNNRGGTETHALLVGSPAIDAGTNSGCPATDQRGFGRPWGAACDIGAFEWVELFDLFLPLLLK